MTSGTWDRHRRRTDTYDVVGLGFNYRIDEPRSALLLSRLRRLEEDIGRRRELVRALPEPIQPTCPVSPCRSATTDVADSSCYVMPILTVDAERRDVLRDFLRDERGIQTSLFYPAVHQFTVYRERFGEVSLPRTEHVAARELTIPLYPHLSADDQDRVVAAIEEGLER